MRKNRSLSLDWSSPEQVRAYNRAYYAANKDRYRGYRATDDPIAKRAYHQQWAQSHRAEYRVYSATYRVTHATEKRAYDLKYAAEHQPENRARLAAWKVANPERHRVAIRAWGLAHPEQLRSYYRKHRFLKAGNGGWHSVEEWLEKCDLFAWCCAYCGEAKPLEEDHNIPLVRGGSDDITNILPACRSCNARKNTKTAAEYLLLTARSLGIDRVGRWSRLALTE